MSLVDYYFLCLPASVEKIKEETEIILNSLPALASNGCKTLYVLLTKVEIYSSFEDSLAEIRQFFLDLLEKSSTLMCLEFISLSSYTGFNMGNLSAVLNGLDKVERKPQEDAKLLVLKTINDKFDKRVAYVQSFGAGYSIGTEFVAYPENKKLKIVEMGVNYNLTSEIPQGMFHTVRLSEETSKLGITRGSVLHQLNKNTEIRLLKEIQIKVDKLKVNFSSIKSLNLKINSCIKIEFKFFTQTLQVTEILDKIGNKIENLSQNRENLTMTLVPVFNSYIENIWTGDKSDLIIVRGKHFSIEGVGKLIEIQYKN